MTIYIYGSKSFKNNIHDVLEHANMKFKLSEDDSITELMSLDELKDAIEEDPTNIFLIDDEKIIRKGALKFLKPKDGIEEEYLKIHGIGDLSVDDISDIATHIVKKLKKSQAQKEAKNEAQKEVLKEEYVEKQNDEIALKNNDYEFVHGDTKQQTTLDQHDEDEFLSAYSQNSELENAHEQDEDDNFDINDVINFDEDEEENENKEDVEAPKEDEESKEEDEVDFEELLDEEETPVVSESNYSNEDLHKEDFGLTIEKIEKDEDSDMSDEFSELDSLNEDELLEALSGSNAKNDTITKSPVSVTKSNAEVELNSSSVHDISSLISQLLNNKTLEITIKIKE